jgi:hypothetical protein
LPATFQPDEATQTRVLHLLRPFGRLIAEPGAGE